MTKRYLTYAEILARGDFGVNSVSSRQDKAAGIVRLNIFHRNERGFRDWEDTFAGTTLDEAQAACANAANAYLWTLDD